MALRDVRIGDTFQREDRPGVAWEVTEILGESLTLRAGREGVVRTVDQLNNGPWRRCEARACMEAS